VVFFSRQKHDEFAMKKNLLMWCIALPMIPFVVGCSCVESLCNPNAPQCSASVALRQSWTAMVGKDGPKTAKAKSQNTGKDELAANKTDEPPPMPPKLLPRFAARVIPNGSTAKLPSTPEPPIDEVITANGTVPSTAQDKLVSIALPDLKKLPPAIQASAPVTIRSDEELVKLEATGIAKDKATPITLKSVHIKYGASENHAVLVGKVTEWRKSLRLRYAAVEQEDKYGGSVMLDGGEILQKVRDGQHVRVRGTLIPAEDRLSSARYRVESVDILD